MLTILEAGAAVRSVPSPTTRCRFGVATRDATPPLNAYARWWGAALHDQKQGVHRPLLTSAAVIAPIDGDGDPLVLVTIDNCVFPAPDERALRTAILERAGLPEPNLMLSPSHSHSSANINTSFTHLPGGEQAQPFLDYLARAIGDAIQEARGNAAPAWITWGTGRCTLARNRDFWDEQEQQFACGFNPAGPEDETLLIGRVTRDDGDMQAVLFNYACHPTTLAWDNDQFSPDYVGAARETVTSIYGVPALFMQGASGELGPRESYVGDTAIADRNGRQLGYAVASTMESLQPAATTFVYQGVRKSGADLGIWADAPLPEAGVAAASVLEAAKIVVPIDLIDMPTVAELQASLETCEDRVIQERLRRFIGKRSAVGDGASFDFPLWVWRLGDAIAVAVPGEAYSVLQTSLRAAFPGTPILVLGVTNGGVGYLPPSDRYQEETLYQVWQSPYAAGSLETVTAAAERQIGAMISSTAPRQSPGWDTALVEAVTG